MLPSETRRLGKVFHVGDRAPFRAGLYLRTAAWVRGSDRRRSLDARRGKGIGMKYPDRVRRLALRPASNPS